MKTGPGRHTGPTAAGGEVTTDREGSQHVPITKPEKAGPSQTQRGAQQKQRNQETQDRSNRQKKQEPKRAKPHRGRKTTQGTEDGKRNMTKNGPRKKRTCRTRRSHEIDPYRSKRAPTQRSQGGQKRKRHQNAESKNERTTLKNGGEGKENRYV